MESEAGSGTEGNLRSEADLIKEQKWGELRRLYSSRSGRSWESAWLQLLQFKDRQAALKDFQKAAQDPRFEEAAKILLWRLGEKIQLTTPPSLRYFLAYQDADFHGMVAACRTRPEFRQHLVLFLERVLDKNSAVTEQDLELVGTWDLPRAAQLYVALLWDRKLRIHQRASTFYMKFLADSWTEKVATESARLFLDDEASQRIRAAYSMRDGLLLKRLFVALISKLEKSQGAAPWKEAFREALEFDASRITENLQGFPFWKFSTWSPLALLIVQMRISPEERKDPEFVTAWQSFLMSKDFSQIPIQLDPDSLALWQIAVETDSEKLSEALLRFPTEERFLFLWSMKNSQVQNLDEKRWPTMQPESDVVRKNLQRAFERSTNKVLWFDRLRQAGCSQDFYEYALSQIEVPTPWILEDLGRGRLRITAGLRKVVKDRLLVLSEKLNVEELKRSLAILTPQECQEVLLSRFVLEPIPKGLLTDEYLDLFYEARTRVGEEVLKSWCRSAIDYILGKDRKTWKERYFRFLAVSWDLDAKMLEKISPQVGESDLFPWNDYLEAAEKHSRLDLILTGLNYLPDFRVKVEWLERLIPTVEDARLLKTIEKIYEPFARHQLLASWYLERNQQTEAYEQLRLALENAPILNDQISILRQLVAVFSKLSAEEKSDRRADLSLYREKMQALGAADENFLRSLRETLEEQKDFSEAWKNAIHEWMLADESSRMNLLDALKRIASESGQIEEMQRFLVDQVFNKPSSLSLGMKLLDLLLNEESAFRLRHLRHEFVDRAIKVFPLHREILKTKAAFDERAALLWDCFYREPLDQRVTSIPQKHKRKWSLWGLTETMGRASIAPFTRFMNFGTKFEDGGYENLNYDLPQKIWKSLKLGGSPRFVLSSHLDSAIKIFDGPPVLVFNRHWAERIDEDMMRCLVFGFAQVIQDREKGLFDDRHLTERFFQAFWLSGASVAQIIQLSVSLARFENLVNTDVYSLSVSDLILRIPFLNQMVVFYLSEDFRRKAAEDFLSLG